MAINWKSYYGRTELIKYFANKPISFERWIRMNNYFKSKGSTGVKLYDHPEGPHKKVYGGLEFASSKEGFIDFLERTNIFQSNSQLLAFPYNLRIMISDLLEDQIEDPVTLKAGLKLPHEIEFPTIITGNLENFILPDELEAIVEPLGVYFPILNLIIIDLDRIAGLAIENTWIDSGGMEFPNFSAAYDIVLKHEIGHWISHEIKLNDTYFEDRKFLTLDSSIHEFWAQIIAYNLLDNDPETQRYMNFLADKQPAIYQYYKQHCGVLSVYDIRTLLSKRELILNQHDIEDYIHEIYT